MDDRTVFHYHQIEDLIWATYSGGSIKFGTITGKIRENGFLEFSYQHVNDQNEIMTGKCVSKPKILEDGRITQEGTHDELKIQEGFYKRIFDQQKSM